MYQIFYKNLILSLFLISVSAGASNPDLDIFWGWSPHLKDVQIDGTLYLRTLICSAVDDENAYLWPITLSHGLKQRTKGAIVSTVKLRGLRTSISQWGREVIHWTTLGDDNIVLNLADQMKGLGAAPAICWDFGESAIVVSNSGWRLYYEKGYLVRALTPRGQLLRVSGHGPWIDEVSTGSLFNPKIVVSSEYLDPVTPKKIFTEHEEIDIEYNNLKSISRVVNAKGSYRLNLTYGNGILSRMTVDGKDIDITWGAIPTFDSCARSVNPYGIFLKEFVGVKYSFFATASTVIVSAHSDAGTDLMTGNIYTKTVKIDHADKK